MFGVSTPGSEPAHPDHPAADGSSVHDCAQRVLPALKLQAEKLFEQVILRNRGGPSETSADEL